MFVSGCNAENVGQQSNAAGISSQNSSDAVPNAPTLADFIVLLSNVRSRLHQSSALMKAIENDPVRLALADFDALLSRIQPTYVLHNLSLLWQIIC